MNWRRAIAKIDIDIEKLIIIQLLFLLSKIEKKQNNCLL